MSGNRNGRGASSKLAQVALVTLGLTLVIASCFALKDVMAAGAVQLSVTESMAGLAASGSRFAGSTALALLLPLGAIISFVAFALTRYSTKGITARRLAG